MGPKAVKFDSEGYPHIVESGALLLVAGIRTGSVLLEVFGTGLRNARAARCRRIMSLKRLCFTRSAQSRTESP